MRWLPSLRRSISSPVPSGELSSTKRSSRDGSRESTAPDIALTFSLSS